MVKSKTRQLPVTKSIAVQTGIQPNKLFKLEPNAMTGGVKKSRAELLESIKNQLGCNLLLIDLNN